MLQSTVRLARSRDIARVWKQGRTASSALVRLRFAPSPVSRPRLAVVVSLKVSKKAVERNQVKRRIHAILGTIVARCAPVDVIVTANPLARNATSAALQHDILPLFVRAGLLRPLV